MRTWSIARTSSLALALLACAHGGEGGRSQTAGASSEGTAAQAQQAPPQASGGEAAAQPQRGTSVAEGGGEKSPGTRPASPGMLPDAAEEDQTAQAAPAETIVGFVDSVEGSSLTVKSTALGDPHQLTLGEDTRFVQQGQAISRDQVEQGDMVRASYVGKAGSGRATEIVVIKKGEGAPADASRSDPTQGTQRQAEPSSPPSPSGQ